MQHGQMEMSFSSPRTCRTRELGRRRQSRAQWWFQRMRQAVDRAVDGRPAAVAPPEQIWLSGSYRQITQSAAGVEAQMCE